MAQASPSTAGFTLVEALVALVLVSVAMLLGLSLFWEQPRVTQRLEAHQEALVAIETALEGIRANAVPLKNGRLDTLPGSGPVDRAGAGQEEADDDELRLLLFVEPTATPNLYQVSVQARYRVRQEVRLRTVETLVWRP